MLYLLRYLLTGIIVLIGLSVIHFIRAELRGYKAFEWWNKNASFEGIGSRRNVLRIMFGLLIWPVRTIYFFGYKIRDYYDMYERK